MEPNKDAGKNEVEGGETVLHGLDTYPLDSLLIRTEPRTIVDVLRRIDQGVIKLDPDFQRDFVWEPERQSRLIESILMRVPLPVFYVAEEQSGKLVVVDGLQRLTTLRHFGKNELKLELKNPELQGKTLDTLSPKLRNRFEDGQLQFYIIDSKAPERVRLDIFDRVNSGVPLTRQQMRNALYSGHATALLRTLAQTAEFQEATGGALDKIEYRTQQRDREVINRFLAFRVLGWRSYDSDMEEFLGRALQKLNSMTEGEREGYAAAFLRSMRINHRVFGRHAFRKHTSPSDRKHPFNVVLFEVFSVLLSLYTEDRVGHEEEDKLRSGFYHLIQEPKFARAISAATTAPESVMVRFDLADAMMRRALGDP
jgi:hypothetical protein